MIRLNAGDQVAISMIAFLVITVVTVFFLQTSSEQLKREWKKRLAWGLSASFLALCVTSVSGCHMCGNGSPGKQSLEAAGLAGFAVFFLRGVKWQVAGFVAVLICGFLNVTNFVSLVHGEKFRGRSFEGSKGWESEKHILENEWHSWFSGLFRLRTKEFGENASSL